MFGWRSRRASPAGPLDWPAGKPALRAIILLKNASLYAKDFTSGQQAIIEPTAFPVRLKLGSAEAQIGLVEQQIQLPRIGEASLHSTGWKNQKGDVAAHRAYLHLAVEFVDVIQAHTDLTNLARQCLIAVNAAGAPAIAVY